MGFTRLAFVSTSVCSRFVRRSGETRDERVKFFRAERFCQELCRSQRQRIAFVLRVAAGRKDDAGECFESFLLADLTEHVQAAQFRHHQVQQREIDVLVVVDEIERLLPVVRDADSIRTLLELHLDDATDVRLIIRDQDVTETRCGFSHDQIRDAMLPR